MAPDCRPERSYLYGVVARLAPLAAAVERRLRNAPTAPADAAG